MLHILLFHLCSTATVGVLLAGLSLAVELIMAAFGKLMDRIGIQPLYGCAINMASSTVDSTIAKAKENSVCLNSKCPKHGNLARVVLSTR